MHRVSRLSTGRPRPEFRNPRHPRRRLVSSQAHRRLAAAGWTHSDTGKGLTVLRRERKDGDKGRGKFVTALDPVAAFKADAARLAAIQPARKTTKARVPWSYMWGRSSDGGAVLASSGAPRGHLTRRQRDQQGAYSKGVDAGRQYGADAVCWYTRPWLVQAWQAGVARAATIGGAR